MVPDHSSMRLSLHVTLALRHKHTGDRYSPQALEGAYTGQNVMVVGRVLQLRGDSALLDSQGNVNLTLNRDSQLVNGNAAQIIGKVNPDLSVKVSVAKDLGNNLDFDLYQSVVEATQQIKPIFQYE
ncbi:unnamed protein product [Parascedosporium putredinis]|uniref:Replication factor A protein 3 n=1 Tax=Parascedosporium putredinis TaxID=1442378 RepID=A0A9P1H2J1_9PEZI|nr:unnamed protein product [Parascedosporium putredinis]CAI7994973.1 unnamed protein product [Parascedosporium putredinis]